MTTLAVEIDGPKNECLSFRPLQRKVRGRFDIARDSEPQSKLAAGTIPSNMPAEPTEAIIQHYYNLGRAQ